MTLDELAELAYGSYYADTGSTPGPDWGKLPERNRNAWRAAAAAIQAAVEVDQQDIQGTVVIATRGGGSQATDPPDDAHLIEVRDYEWAIQHPLSCRPRLLECPVHQAASRYFVPPSSTGAYYCDVDEADLLVIGARYSDVRDWPCIAEHGNLLWCPKCEHRRQQTGPQYT